MVRLSSRDASLLMDLLEQTNLTELERLQLLDGADGKVIEIGKALLNPDQNIEDPEIKEAVDSIHKWAEETRESEDNQRLYA